MNPNVRPSDRAALVGVIDPQSATTAKSTGWVKATENMLAVISAGAFATSATLAAKLEQATSDAGAGAKDITGKAITALTEAGTDDNKQALINLRAEELDVENDFDYVRLTLTPAVDAVLIHGQLFAFDANYQPHAHAATVDEVV